MVTPVRPAGGASAGGAAHQGRLSIPGVRARLGTAARVPGAAAAHVPAVPAAAGYAGSAEPRAVAALHGRHL